MGRKEDALREGQRSSYFRLRMLSWSSYLEHGSNSGRVGNADEAISLLRQLLDMPAILSASRAAPRSGLGDHASIHVSKTCEINESAQFLPN
jgi:hypothetical protein